MLSRTWLVYFFGLLNDNKKKTSSRPVTCQLKNVSSYLFLLLFSTLFFLKITVKISLKANRPWTQTKFKYSLTSINQKQTNVNF